MSLRVVIVQHADKERLPGDPGLTGEGVRQADATGTWLASLGPERVVAVWSSPMKRARETAAAIARHFHLAIQTDARLRERMNWDGGYPLEDFQYEWQRASVDRSFQPKSGDSSEAAAVRFLAALEDLRVEHTSGTAIVVAHGGVTTDMLRTLLGDDRLDAVSATVVQDGVACCAITTLVANSNEWTVQAVADVSHLMGTSPHLPS